MPPPQPPTALPPMPIVNQTTPPPNIVHIPPATHPYSGSHYRYPVMPPSFPTSSPPFPHPHLYYLFETFINTTQLEQFIARCPNLNDSYIAIPLPFWTRYREPNRQGRPTFGYFIHR